MKYNYENAVREDVDQAIADRYTEAELVAMLRDDGRDSVEENFTDELWTDDAVTGNASGSYTFNTYAAEENLHHNMDLLAEACDEFGYDVGDAIGRGAEYCDVTIRCALLRGVISDFLDEFENEHFDEINADEDEDEDEDEEEAAAQ